MLHNVLIFSKDNNPKTRNAVENLKDVLNARDIRIEVFHMAEDTRPLSGVPDLILSVGGDGTFLETVLRFRELGVPVAGVNTGRMGFLANIPGDDIAKSVDQLIRNEYEIIERSMLEIVKPDHFFEGDPALALNEITIQKANLSMITIHVYVDDVFLSTYWADGLIVSTATGSTAYNLSAGGPILTPGDESIIISPISPHNLTLRPILLSGNSRLKMVMEARTDECLVTCDSRFSRHPISREIHISRSGTKLKTVMLEGRDFYSTLRNRLMWGLDRRN